MHREQLMRAPANLEAGVRTAMWRKRRRMFERVVDRPEMWLTNEQRWILIRPTRVLVCVIESGLKEAFNVCVFLFL